MAAGDLVIDCTNKDLLDIFTLLNSCFGVDASGKKYLRQHVYTQDADEENAIACIDTNLSPIEQFGQLVRECIVMNGEDKPSIRVGHL